MTLFFNDKSCAQICNHFKSELNFFYSFFNRLKTAEDGPKCLLQQNWKKLDGNHLSWHPVANIFSSFICSIIAYIWRTLQIYISLHTHTHQITHLIAAHWDHQEEFFKTDLHERTKYSFMCCVLWESGWSWLFTASCSMWALNNFWL